jgi:hypothetical protein
VKLTKNRTASVSERVSGRMKDEGGRMKPRLPCLSFHFIPHPSSFIPALTRSLDRAAIRDALAQTRDFPGVTGTVTFNSDRNALKPIVIVRIGDYGKQTVEAHVTPEDLTPTPTPTPSPTPRRGARQ